MGDEEITKMIPEQNILIDGIATMSGNHALSLNHNFKLKRLLYKLPSKENNWVNYVVLNDFTTFLQLIHFLTLHYIISLESHEYDGFTMIITIENKRRMSK